MTSMRAAALVLAAVGTVMSGARASDDDELPVARRSDRVDTYHGVAVPDPYHWMEEWSDETEAWVRAQADAAERALSALPGRARLAERFTALASFAGAGVPRVAGGRAYFNRRIPGANVSAIYRADAVGGEPRLLVDPVGHPASPAAGLALSQPIPSPDGRFVLYAASGPSLSPCLRVLDAASGEDREDDTVWMSYQPWRAAWAADSQSFYYVVGSEVRRHRLGQGFGDEVVYRDTSSTAHHVAVQTTADGHLVLVSLYHPFESRNTVLVRATSEDESGGGPHEWTDLFPDSETTFRFVAKRGERLYVFTNADAPRGRVIALTVDRPEPEHWMEIVPEAAETILDDNHPLRPSVGVFGEHLVVMYDRGGHLVLRVRDLDGRLEHEVVHAELGFSDGGIVGEPDGRVARYDLQSTVDPGTAWELDLATGERRIVGRPIAPFDPDDFVMEQRSYASFDGTEVPIFLAYGKGLERDGERPVLIQAGGAFGGVAKPVYLPETMAWLEMGGVFAYPGIRGGGEGGPAWYEAGRRRNKQTTIDDLVSAARWLAEEGYTRPGRTALHGMSAAGPAATAAVQQHPRAFGAALIKISTADMLDHPALIAEFGDPADEGDFHALMGWSPYHNAREQEYPPMLVQVGELDSVARPFHGYKLVAALQDAQRGEAPIRLQVVWGTGHNQGTGVPWQAQTHSRQLAFVAHHLGMDARAGTR